MLSLIMTTLVSAAGAQTADPRRETPSLRQQSGVGVSGESAAFDIEASRGERAAEVLALPEGPIDPDKYVLGPDDRLDLAIWGAADFYYPLVIRPEGSVFIPNVGVIDVAALTLTEARARIRSRVLAVFSSVEVDVVLSGLRRFKVHVVGAVERPGAYPATAVSRVSEVLALAGDVLELASRRRIRLDARSGREQLVDLVAYELTGVTEHNPFVTDGAIIEVPRRTTRLLVSGAVTNPGTYEPRTDERLSDLLDAIGGLDPSADSSAVTLTHFVTSVETETLIFAYAPGTASGDPWLVDGDAVFFRERPDWHRFGQAFVYGAVHKPGRYPIPLDGIRLSQLIALAGGVTARANLAQGHVLRPHERFTPDVGAHDEVAPSSPVMMRQSVLDATIDTILVRTDFERALTEGSSDEDILVRDGDVVQVPEDRAEVRVVGLVRRPGAYPFVAGLDVNDYIRMAEGYDKDADKGRVRMSPFYGAPARQTQKDEPVASGAIIEVPEKDRSRRTFLDNARDITAIVVQAVSLVVLVDRLTE